MKRNFLVVIVVILIIFMDVPLGFAAEYKTASVVEVTGMVSIFKAGGEKSFTPKVGTILEHGDRIITGKGASIALQIDSDKYIKVDEKTYMSLSELMSEAESGGDSTNIKLFTGKVWASLSKPLRGDDSFEIETPTAVMGAKGTKFMVKYVLSPTQERKEKTGTGLVVLDGEVSMSTQVGTLSEQGTALSSQEVELLVNPNETLLLDPVLVQGISDEIERRLKNGETIDQINIQEVVSKVGKAKQIEVKNLDLFVLEIIADEPDAYDPTLTDGLDQLIEQKKGELPPEDDFTGPNSLNYETLSDIGSAAGPVIPREPTMPTMPNPPAAPQTSTAHFGNNSGTTPIDTPPASGFYVTSAATIDADGDGSVDHLQVTFNNPVDDSTFVSENGIILQSKNLLDPVDDSVLVTNLIGEYADSADDAIVYLKLDHTANSILYNTGSVGTLTIPSGTIKKLEGLSNNSISNLTTVDHAAPVLVDSELDLSLPYDEKFISLKFSEPLNESDVVDVSTIKLMSSGMYASGPIDLYGTTSVLGDQIFIKPLEVGSVGGSDPSFISRLSKNLYYSNNPTGGTASIRLSSGFAISSDHGESYELPTEHSYPYDGPALSSIKRINNTSAADSVGTSATSIRVTYTDYLESWNDLSHVYMPATIKVSNVSKNNYEIFSKGISSDHKTLEIELDSLPQVGDIIGISHVRNITNSHGDEVNTAPIYAQDVSIIFDGTNWHLAD